MLAAVTPRASFASSADPDLGPPQGAVDFKAAGAVADGGCVGTREKRLEPDRAAAPAASGVPLHYRAEILAEAQADAEGLAYLRDGHPTRLDWERVRWLPPEYNYPLNLLADMPPSLRARRLNSLVNPVYEEAFPWDEIEVEEPLRSWLVDLMSGREGV